MCFGVIWGHPKKSKNLYKYISHGTKFMSGEFCECTSSYYVYNNSWQILLEKPFDLNIFLSRMKYERKIIIFFRSRKLLTEYLQSIIFVQVCIKEYHAVTLSRCRTERFGIEYETVEERLVGGNEILNVYPRLFVRDVLPSSIAQIGGSFLRRSSSIVSTSAGL